MFLRILPVTKIGVQILMMETEQKIYTLNKQNRKHTYFEHKSIQINFFIKYFSA